MLPDPTPPGVPRTLDAVIIGAGPVGLFQAFQCGLLGLRCALVEALPHVGGQCAELYADKGLYDVPGLPATTGAALVAQLQAQIAPLAPPMHLGQLVQALRTLDDGGFELTTDQGLVLPARSVFIAAGVGAFVPRRLAVAGLERHEGRQVFHHAPPAAQRHGRHLVVAGGEELALRRALAWATDDEAPPASVTLLHRRDRFPGVDEALLAQVQALREAGHLAIVAGMPQGVVESADGRLTGLQLLGADGQDRLLPLDTLAVSLGLSPRLGPIADWGLAMERKLLTVDTAGFQTSVPGIHAVGDICHYPGKRRLLVCGFHEATLAAYAAAERLRGAPVTLQYTTSSAHLQQLLGVAGSR